MTREQVIESLIEKGELERVPDSDPPQLRMTPETQVTNITLAYEAMRAQAHLIARGLHEYLDQMGDVITGLRENEPFGEDDIPIDDDDDEGDHEAWHAPAGYL